MVMKTDITIIGAGLVGMTAAIALVQTGLDVVVIDSADLDEVRKKESDGRTCAIAAGSKNFFQEIGVWDDMKAYAGEICDIRVTDGNSPIFLHYDHKLIGNEPMGYIIENYYIREALFKKAKEEGRRKKGEGKLNIIAPARYTDVQFGDDECVVSVACHPERSEGSIIANKRKILRYAQDDNITIHSQLIIAADGKKSNIRKLAGIRTHEWNYGQSGIVCTIAHENHHQFTAQERFLPEGPFAVLPMAGGYHSSLVWTEKNALVPVYMSMPPTEIEEQILLRTGEYLGKIKLASRMYSYPLSLCKAKTYIGKNLILIGDAAHAMHPLAGQGFNVGIRDVEELTTLIRARREGLREKGEEATQTNYNFFPSPLALNSSPLLEDYETARMADSIALLGITDILNRAFSNNILPLKTARRLGMAAVNKATPLKKFFMKHAMGVE